MTKARRCPSTLSLLAVAAGMITPLPAAVSALSPLGLVQAASTADASLQSLAQVVARHEDEVTPEHLQALILAKRRDYTLVDIRAPEAFAAGHIRGAANIPLPRLMAADEIIRLRKLPQVIVYADATDQAAQATVMLRMSGVPALQLAGGLHAWARWIDKQAAEPEAASIVRALNACPEPAAAAIPPLNTAAPPAAAGQAPAKAVPPAPKKAAPVILNGMCG